MSCTSRLLLIGGSPDPETSDFARVSKIFYKLAVKVRFNSNDPFLIASHLPSSPMHIFVIVITIELHSANVSYFCNYALSIKMSASSLRADVFVKD